MASASAEKAPAKINLTLRVLDRRSSGYHDIESLVAFAALGDAVTFTPGRALALTVRGPTARSIGAVADNLVLRAARALAERVEGLELGRFVLFKRLPIAAGLGGGSADAAAALRLLAKRNRLPLGDFRLLQAALATGADVPVCLDPQPRWMRGIGDILSDPVRLPPFHAVLVNPGMKLSTRDVFAALGLETAADERGASPRCAQQGSTDAADLLRILAEQGNDLEGPAISLAPVIADVLIALRALAGCRLARMSGSGATCFGLFASRGAAKAAAQALRVQHPAWWVRATVLA